MGLFNKLKSMASAITGGGAKVYVEAVSPSREVPFHVQVKAVIGDADLKVNRVYVKLQGQETVIVRSVPVARNQGSQVQTVNEDVQRTETTFEQEFSIAGAQTLSAKQEYAWEAQVQFPAGAPSSYQGRNARHELKILAGIDTTGNDPDSGWIDLGLV